MFLCKPWLYLPIFFLTLAPLNAQELPPTKELPKETIESKKEPALQKTEIIKIISKEEINKTTPYLIQILKRVTGIRISEAGGIGQYASAIIRGSTSQQIKIYQDGIPVPESRFGSADLSKISLSNIETIEVYKGFVPAYLGNSNMGAAINLISKKENSQQKVEGSTTFTYGSFESYLFSTNLRDNTTQYQENFSIDFVKAKNNYQFHNDRGTPYNTADDSIDHKTNNAFQELNIHNDFTRKLENFNVSAQINGKSGTQELGGPQNANIKETKNTFNELFLSTSIKNSNKEKLQWESSLFTSLNNNILSDPLGEIGFTPDHIRNTLYTIGNKNYLHWNFSDYFYSNFLLEPKEELNHKTDLINQQDSYWKRKSVLFTFEPGLILWQEKLEIKTSVSDLYLSDSVFVFDKNEIQQTSSLLNLQLSAQFISDSNHRLQTSFGKVYRAPSLFELFGDTGLVIGNKQLKEESTLFAECAWSKNFQSDRFHLSTDLSITGFIKKENNLISYQQISSGITRPFNIDESLISGFETELFLNQTYFEYLLQYTFTDAVNKTNDSFKSNKQIPGIPMHHLFSELTLKYKKWKWFYRCSFSSKEYFDEINLIIEPDRFLQDIGINYSFQKIELTAELKNLANKQVEDFANYPLPGRSLWLKINIPF